MRKFIVLPVVGLCVALAVAVSARSASAPPASVDEFVALATRGVDADYEPLVSPEDAVDKGDLVVEGTLVDVIDGISLRFPNPTDTQRQAGSHVTLVLEVTRVIDGDAGTVAGGRVYVALAKSPVTGLAELSAANPRPTAVAVLDDITAWRPGPGVTVTRPTGVPAGAALFAPYTDGLWLQARDDPSMRGLGADRDDLGPAWGGPRTLSDLSAALRRASGR